jgi:regulator of protease activity HflC (stomatin/prohibitin superfamily)
MKESFPNVPEKSKKLLIAGVTAVFLISTIGIISPFKTIESGNVGVKVTLGKYDNEELQPGLHFKLPVIQQIKEVDVKVHAINYKGNRDLKDKQGVINKPAITVLDQRGLPIEVELTVQYRLLPDEVSETLQEWGENWEEKLVNPICREVVRDVIGDYPAETIPTKRPEIAKKIEEGIRREITEQSKKAVQVVGVQLRNILLPSEIQDRIKAVQIAKQEAERMKYVEEQAKREQEVKKIKAETEKIEKVIKAQAEAERKVIQAKAEAEARLKKAEAEAKANEMLSKSITPKVLKWRELDVQEKIAESLKENPNVKLFLNVPQSSNFHMWLNQEK